jgi:hypothetical protein
MTDLGEQRRIVVNPALVQPEGELVNVAIKMLRAGVVIDAKYFSRPKKTDPPIPPPP